MVAVGVPDRDAEDDNRDPFARKVDLGAVGAAAGADGLLGRDAGVAGGVQRVPHEPGVGDHPEVIVAEHDPAAEAGLDLRFGDEGIVRRRPFKDDREVGTDGAGGNLDAAVPHLFLGREDTGHVDRQLLPLQFPQDVADGGAADPAVESLAQHHAVFLVVFKQHVRDDRRAGADPHPGHLFSRTGADVNDHIRNLRGFPPLGRRQVVDRLGRDNAGHPAAVPGADPHLMGRNGRSRPAAEGQKPHRAVREHRTDHKPDLIRMGVQHHHRAAAGVLPAGKVEV